MRRKHLPRPDQQDLFSLLDHFNSKIQQVLPLLKVTPPIKKKKQKGTSLSPVTSELFDLALKAPQCLERLSSQIGDLHTLRPWTCFCGLRYWQPGKVDVITLCIVSLNMHLGSLAFPFHFAEAFLLGSVNSLMANPVKPSLSLSEHLGSFGQLYT